MKCLIILGMLLILAKTTEVLVSNQCLCDKLVSQGDCKAKSGCSWSSTTSLCSTNTQTVTEGYCTLITDSTSCAKTKGCAYINSGCVIFAGCTAYKGATDAECQITSKFCNSDGIAYCVSPGTCSNYKTEENCTRKASSLGSGTCVWDTNLCRDQKCTEADPTFNTNTQCNNYISGCVTNGKGCVSQLGLCSTYTGDVDSCQGLVGLDGYCKGVDGMTKCQSKVCTDADITLTSDSACSAYQIDCVTNGYGCVKSPLGQCSTLTGDDLICANKRGSDGKCKGVVNGKICSVVVCSDAADTLTTDAACDDYKKGCVTTGKGCTTSRGACSSYKGTSTTCDGYIGTDGKCKGASDAEAACSPKVCTAADTSLNTDDQCNEYQTGCKTTGKGCVATLSTCSSYTGDSTTCDGYVGTDGKCKGAATSGPCSAKVCSEASLNLTTNEDCADYQTGCIASGTGGCILAGSCSALLLSTQCDGKKTCQWTPQCVKNVVCTDLSSEILCKTVTLQDGTTCWWVNSACTTRACTQAPNTYDTDSQCDSFLKGCLTNKKGCLPPTSICPHYQGSKSKCESFTIKCTNTEAATDTLDCQDITCASNTTATSDSACDQHHKGCLTKGTGCIDPTAACNQYDGTSTDICGKFTGNNIKCWWTTGNTKCKDKECADADSSYTTDAQCQQFLKGCLTTGMGCISDDAGCGGYSGTQAVCNIFSKGCARSEYCTEKQCHDITGASSQSSCDAILPGVCWFVKDACIKIGVCTEYKHATVDLSVAECKILKDTSGNYCYWTTGKACESRNCGQITGSSITAANCQDHLSSCQVKANASGCETADCSKLTGTGLTLSTCRAYLDTCAVKSDGTVCETLDCSKATDKTNEAGCQLYHPKCHYHQTAASTDACINSTNCSEMTMFPVTGCLTVKTNSGGKCQAGSGNACADFTTATGITASDCTQIKAILPNKMTNKLWTCFLNGSNCEIRDCSKAATHLGTTITSQSQCTNYLEACVLSYTAPTTAVCIDGYTGTTLASHQYGCEAIQGTDTQCATILMGRYLSGTTYYLQACKGHGSGNTVTYCVTRSCTDIDEASGIGVTDAACQAYLSTCKTNGVSCIDLGTSCNNLESTAEGCANFTGITIGSKCQQIPSISGSCQIRTCVLNGSATTDAECEKYLTGCITSGKGCVPGTTKCTSQYGNQDGCKLLTGNGKKCWSTSTTTKGTCIDRTCSHNTIATTDADCDLFLKGCLTKGTGCIDNTAECGSYQGTQADCEKFIGNSKSCTNDATATVSSSCKVKDCTQFQAEQYTELICQAYGKHCHYNGTKCDVISTCSNLKGSFVSCATFVASDGPCKGTALQTDTPTSCSIAKCSDAPLTLTTDADCKAYKNGCVTNGRGCASSVNCIDVQSEQTCLAITALDKNICTWASQCRDVSSSCSSFTSNGQSVCLQSKVTSGFGLCVWKNSACTEALCEDLPLTVASDDDCVTYSKTCTFAGIGKGCITKGQCKSYTTKDACANAKSNDSIGVCTWDETITTGTQIFGCRPKDCQDAPITITSDLDCDAFIVGCKTNGAGCITPPFVCTAFKTAAKCLQDTNLQPCLWYNNQCSQYYKCEDLPLKTVSACQTISKFCTTDDSKCIALKTCENYTKQSQCVIGTDGTCGWVTATKKCQLYTQCTDLVSKVNSECVAFNQNCISNGINCISIGECQSYADSETACKLGGTDGTCFFDKSSTACRLRQCSDSTTSTTTHNGCYGFAINSTTKCTTDGTSCIPLASCSTYKQAGCVTDSSNNACIWDTTSKVCKQKLCTDIKKTKSSDCATALSGCVSNGTNCITKGKCAEYSNKESCSAGGSDGSCAFTPSSSSATTGTCKLFSQCSDANSDQNACQSKSAACKWSAASATTASSCAVQTCDTAAKGTAKCVTVPNFTATSYTVCTVSGGKCVAGDPSVLTEDSCFKMSQYTYSWNTNTKKCIACGGSGTIKNDSSIGNNDSNEQPQSTTNSGIISLLVAILILVN